MLNALAASSLNTADIVILVVIAVGLLYGLYSGFARLLGGLFGTLIAIVGAIILGYYLCGTLAEVDAFQNITDKMVDFFESKASFTTYDAKVENGTLFLLYNGTWTGITDIEMSKIASTVAKLLQTLFTGILSGQLVNGNALSESIALVATKILCAVIIFIAGVIVLMILLAILTRILSGIVEKHKPLRTADRLFGLLLGAIFIIVIVFLAMLIIARLGDTAAVVTDSIADSTVAKWFYDNNPFLMF